MKTVLRVIDSISEWTGRIVSPVAYASAFILVYEIISRNVFNKPSPWAHEYSVFFFGLLILAGGYTHLHRLHVSVDILYRRWPLRARAIIDLLTASLFFLLTGLMLWKGADIAWRSIQVQEVDRFSWGPPLYIVKTMIPVAAFFIILQGLAKFMRDSYIAVKGRVLDEH